LINQLPADFTGRTSSEAELFADYLAQYEGVTADYLETQSTNCGNNITYLLDLLTKENLPRQRMLFIQGSTMQYRMGATLKKIAPDVELLHFAAYRVKVTEDLHYEEIPQGMWPLEHYVGLLLGEISRLRNDRNCFPVFNSFGRGRPPIFNRRVIMTEKILASLSAALWFLQAFLHFLLLMGVPLGAFVFGGSYTVFPLWLRPANLALCLLWSFFGYSYLLFGRVLTSSWQEKTLTRIVGLVTIFLGLATLFNFFISGSFFEKYVTGSITLLTFLISLFMLYRHN